MVAEAPMGPSTRATQLALLAAAMLVCMLAQRAQSACPTPDELPLVTEKGNFVCAESYFSGENHVIPALSCNGKSDTWEAGKEEILPCEERSRHNSLVIKAGCRMVTYNSTCLGKPVNKTVYQGPVLLSRFPPEGHDKQVGYLRCECDMEPIACKPRDQWESIRICDATEAQQDMVCKFNHHVGTDMHESLIEQMDIGPNIYDHLETQFFKAMGRLGRSETTEFDWKRIPEHVRWDTRSVESSAVVPAGHTLEVLQVVGYCGKPDNVVRTQTFKYVQRGRGSQKEDLFEGTAEGDMRRVVIHLPAYHG